MYYELSQKEIQRFIKRYFNIYDDEIKKINHISVIEYNGIEEYMINHRYILRIYNKK